jgi:hypothetical protein
MTLTFPFAKTKPRLSPLSHKEGGRVDLLWQNFTRPGSAWLAPSSLVVSPSNRRSACTELAEVLRDRVSNPNFQIQSLASYTQAFLKPFLLVSNAAGQGFGPRFTASKAAVLPLDDPAALATSYQILQ